MANKNIYGELIKQANKAEMLKINNDGTNVSMLTPHWVFQTTTDQYDLAIASGIKGFPVVRKGDCYTRNGKGNAEPSEPKDVSFFKAGATGISARVMPFNYILKGDITTRLIDLGNNGIMVINNDYYKIAESLMSGSTEVTASSSIKPVMFTFRENEWLLICPIGGTEILEDIKVFTKYQILSAKNPETEEKPVESEPVKSEPVKTTKAKAEKKAEPKKSVKKAESKKASKKAEKKAEPVKAEPVKESNASYTLNAEHKGIEIAFRAIPSSVIRTELKANGYRWHNAKKVWYAKQNDKTMALAESLVRA